MDLSTSDVSITRAVGNYADLIAEMDDSTYGSIEGYLSIYSYSFQNSKSTINKTLNFSHQVSNYYRNRFIPNMSDPSGYGIYYILPVNSNYINPNSPRSFFTIINNPPEILDTSSKFNFGGFMDIYFDETESDEGSFVYSTTQGDIFNFGVDVRDSVNYEDDNFDMRVFVNLFICSVTDDGYVILIFPQSLRVSELNYRLTSDKFQGSFTIPDTLRYNTISGIKSISTATNFNIDTNEGYLALLYITVYDSEGGTDEFLILLLISGRPFDFTLIIIIVISIIALIGVVSMMVYYARRKKYPRASRYQPSFEEYSYQPSYEEQEEGYITPEPVPQLGPSMYCPFCGEYLQTLRKFCPHCGESLKSFQQNE
jgi:hypothetical protein